MTDIISALFNFLSSDIGPGDGIGPGPFPDVPRVPRFNPTEITFLVIGCIIGAAILAATVFFAVRIIREKRADRIAAKTVTERRNRAKLEQTAPDIKTEDAPVAGEKTDENPADS